MASDRVPTTDDETGISRIPELPFRSLVLAEDLCSRVERIDGGGGSVIRKTYLAPPFRLWRSFLMRSRGRREFDNLSRLSAAGVHCVHPVSWGETRLLGCAPVSWIVTEALDAHNLGVALTALSRHSVQQARARQALATRYGALARSLHHAGFLSTTLQPRNVLVAGTPSDPQLRLCDQPALVSFAGSIHLSRLGRIDLFDMAFSRSRRRQWTRSERFRMVLAYTDRDRGAARELWRRVGRRKPWVQQVLRELARAVGRVRPMARVRTDDRPKSTADASRRAVVENG